MQERHCENAEGGRSNLIVLLLSDSCFQIACYAAMTADSLLQNISMRITFKVINSNMQERHCENAEGGRSN